MAPRRGAAAGFLAADARNPAASLRRGAGNEATFEGGKVQFLLRRRPFHTMMLAFDAWGGKARETSHE
jgi:hypothetical protein